MSSLVSNNQDFETFKKQKATLSSLLGNEEDLSKLSQLVEAKVISNTLYTYYDNQLETRLEDQKRYHEIIELCANKLSLMEDDEDWKAQDMALKTHLSSV